MLFRYIPTRSGNPILLPDLPLTLCTSWYHNTWKKMEPNNLIYYSSLFPMSPWLLCCKILDLEPQFEHLDWQRQRQTCSSIVSLDKTGNTSSGFQRSVGLWAGQWISAQSLEKPAHGCSWIVWKPPWEIFWGGRTGCEEEHYSTTFPLPWFWQGKYKRETWQTEARWKFTFPHKRG